MNIAELIREQARENPGDLALIYPVSRDRRGRFSYRTLSFRQLDQLSDRLAFRFKNAGLGSGRRILLFVRPSPEFSLATFALFKVGAIPVLIDPGMGFRKLLKAVRDARPEVLIAEPLVCVSRWFLARTFATVHLVISVRGWVPSALSLGGMLYPKGCQRHRPGDLFPVCSKKADDQAAIVFTSGGTGPPKGVEYNHGMLLAQVRLLKELFQLGPGDRDMPAFPLFSLMTQAMGVCSVIPPMNPAKPARAKPADLLTVIQDQEVTSAGGSPAVWERLADHCLEQGVTLPSLRSLMMFGAPVSPGLLRDFDKVMPGGDTWTPYGATECLPVSCISGREVPGGPLIPAMEYPSGVCVGKAVPGTRIRIIKPIAAALTVSVESGTEARPGGGDYRPGCSGDSGVYYPP